MRFTDMLPGSVYLSLALITVKPSLATITNRTIDDTRGDLVTGQSVIYEPGISAKQWRDNRCTDCAVIPDPTQTFDETWTAAVYFKQTKGPINATMSFNGIAVYVFFILANNAGPKVITKTVANITLDDQPPTLFEHIPDMNRTDLQYNALVFSQTNLTNTNHSLVISISDIHELIYINFDYVIYTHDDLGVTPNSLSTTATPLSSTTASADLPAGKPPAPIGPIVGGAVGGVVAIIVLTVTFRQRKQWTDNLQRAGPEELKHRPPALHSIEGVDGQRSSRSEPKEMASEMRARVDYLLP